MRLRAVSEFVVLDTSMGSLLISQTVGLVKGRACLEVRFRYVYPEKTLLVERVARRNMHDLGLTSKWHRL